MGELVYFDNNATTKPCEEAVAAMIPYLTEWYGNPSSVHRFGQASRKGIDEARGQVAQLVGCSESELMFTGGGTEAISTAIRGLLAARGGPGGVSGGGTGRRKRIVTTTVEHSATRELCQALARSGEAEVVEIAVDRDGHLDLEAYSAALSSEVALVSVMWANNETGAVFPVKTLVERAQEFGVPVHVDATQAVGKVDVNLSRVGAAAASFASHKFHGPKGVGALYVRKGVRVRPLIVGGPQERGRRGGTENVPGIVGMGAAAQVAREQLGQMGRVAALRDAFEARLLQDVAESSVNGAAAERLPNTTNVAFHRLEAEAILLLLSEQGICASAGAACSSGSLEPSHVLRAMGIESAVAHGAVRFSLSRYSTEAEVNRVLDVLPAVIARLRRVLPVGT